MRWLALAILIFAFSMPARAQVDADSASEEDGTAPAAVGAPGRYYLNNSSNTVEVGRPYPYYYYPYYGYGPYGVYRPGVQAVPDANDPNYFPMDAVMAPPPPAAPAKKKSAPKPTNLENPSY